MTLELERVAQALPRVGEAAEAERRRNAERRSLARRVLQAAPPTDEIEARVRATAGQESLAIPLEPPAAIHAAPPPLDRYTIVAVDGSHHELGRFDAAACAVVNLGGWRIHYGPDAAAEELYDLRVLTPLTRILDDGGLREGEGVEGVSARSVTGPLLGSYRAAWEALFLSERLAAALQVIDDGNQFRGLKPSALGTSRGFQSADTPPSEQSAEPIPSAQAAASNPQGPSQAPIVALLDGVLLPWTIPGNDEAARRQVAAMFVRALDRLRDATAGRLAAVGSYISRPNAGEVMNLLALLSEGGRELLARGADRLVFADLAPGERGATFRTYSAEPSWPQREHFSRAGHETAFFYVNTAAGGPETGEVARVEFPAWLCDRPGALDLLHAAVLDQCRRGSGYPIALQEAHERATLSGPDRRAFEMLIERELAGRGIVAAAVGKGMSKRVRGL